MLKSITIKNWKSFNVEGITVPLTNLNILIGGPGSGKSNFLKSVDLIRELHPALITGIGSSCESRNDISLPAEISGVSSKTKLCFVFTERKLSSATGYGICLTSVSAGDRVLDRSEMHQLLSNYSIVSEFNSYLEEERGKVYSLEDIVTFQGSASELLKELAKESIPGFTEWRNNDRVNEGQSDFTYATEDGRELNTKAMSLGARTFIEICMSLHLTESKLVTIDNPDSGIHPDLFPKLAERIKVASETKQIILSTNSREFLDCFSDRVGDICVVSNDGSGSKIERLDADKMKVWTDKYSLSYLWSSGHLGANRW